MSGEKCAAQSAAQRTASIPAPSPKCHRENATRIVAFSHAVVIPFALVCSVPEGMVLERFPMKTHTVLKFTVASLALAFATNIPAQTAAPAPNAKGSEAKPAPAADPQIANLETMNVSLAYEAFSLPIAKAGELQRKGMTDDELYKEVVVSGKLERLLVLRTKSGQRAVVENVTNYIYPTEFTQPQIPGSFSSDKIQPPPIPLPVAPTAFEKKDVGDSLEAEPTLSQDAKSVDFQFRVSHVGLARREKWGREITELEQPQFEMQTLSTNATASVGSPRLVGTLNPVFGNGLAARAEQNVWFCFITATVAQNNAVAPGKTAR